MRPTADQFRITNFLIDTFGMQGQPSACCPGGAGQLLESSGAQLAAHLTTCIPPEYTVNAAMFDPNEWEGFDWDDGNIGKNWAKHRVTDCEIEEVFFNSPVALGGDTGHSHREPRFFALGQTNRGRWLFVAFTVRRNLVRPISARDMNARERNVYESTKEDSDVQG